MSRLINLTGHVFGRLTVIARNFDYCKTRQARWLCVCNCGNTVIVTSSNLWVTNTQSCGCYRTEKIIECGRTHGLTGSAEYQVWLGMKHRCYNKNNQAYQNYGERGIIVCDRWVNSFENFLTDMGNRPANDYDIDRVDNNLGYSPDNCRWTTRLINGRNKRNSKYWFINGKRYDSAYHAAEELNVCDSTISRWCEGIIKNGVFISPKENCYSQLKY